MTARLGAGASVSPQNEPESAAKGPAFPPVPCGVPKAQPRESVFWIVQPGFASSGWLTAGHDAAPVVTRTSKVVAGEQRLCAAEKVSVKVMTWPSGACGETENEKELDETAVPPAAIEGHAPFGSVIVT